MSIIFINGLNAKAGGGKSILTNFLTLLKRSNSKDSFLVLTPNKNEFSEFSCQFIQIIDIPNFYKNKAFLPFFNHFIFPSLLQKFHVDVIFNLADIVVPTKIPQLYLFDWSYAVYPDSVAWKRMDFKSYLYRKVKLFFFKKYIGYADIVVAQSETMKERLESIYHLKNIVVVPNAVALNSKISDEKIDFCLPRDKKKLVYISYYYPHKNLEILIPLAEKLKKLSLPYCIVTTIDASQHFKAKHFLSVVKKKNLNDIIINLGNVDMSHIHSLYSQVDALLMPTLLESFSGSYVEAMHHGKTIFTSNFDFAQDVCGDAAFYFDPLSVDLILSTILLAFESDELRFQKINEGRKKLRLLLNWEQAFIRYKKLIYERIEAVKASANLNQP